VLASEFVRYEGEPVALVAADHPETARRAAQRIRVDYEVLPAVTDPRRAMDDDAPAVHRPGNLVRHLQLRRGDPDATAPVVVSLDFEVGMQDQAFLGPESGLAVPAEDGGVDLFVATQWLHVDQRQVCLALGMPSGKVRLHLAGVGGAFGGREDLSVHVHACLLALRTGRP
jgi:CO/xanthine dehydrogenase Mo-binding subunit